MKSKFALILAGTAALSCMTACDDINEADRFVPVQPVESNRTVLLEDYTGQLCRNCPEAHEIIEGLEKQYGDRFIAVSIHAGSFGVAAGSSTLFEGLMQPQGTGMADKRGITEYPQGVIDGGKPLGRSAWAASVLSALEIPATCEISGSVTYTGSDATIAIDLLLGESFHGKIGMWVVEDNIVSIQQNGAQLVMQYTHNNVWRGSVTPDVWGEDVSGNLGEKEELAFNYTLDKTWKPENCKLVVFVTNNNGDYMQAASIPFKAAE